MPTFDQLRQGIPSGEALLWATILPFVLGLFFAALAVRRAGSGRSAAWGASVALLAAWTSIHLEIWGVPPLPPIMAYDWLALGVPLAAIAALWTAANRERPGQGRAIQIVAALTLVGVTLWPRLSVAGWSVFENVWRSVVYGGAILAAWIGAVRGARLRPARESLALQHVVAGYAAIAIGMAGTQNLAQASGGVAAALAGMVIAVLFRADSAGRLASGSAPVAAAATGGLLLNGSLYAYVELDVYLLALAPFLLAPLGSILWPARRSLVADLLRVVVLASPAVLAAVLAVLRFQVEAADEGGSGYY